MRFHWCKIIFFASSILANTGVLTASKPYYATNAPLEEAYKSIQQLKINQATNQLSAIRLREPDNLMVDFYEDYIDFFVLAIGENEAKYHQLAQNRSKRIYRLEEGPETSPYHTYAPAEVHLHWALVKAKFGDYLSAAMDIKKAWGLLNECLESHPQFIPARRGHAVLQTMIGTIPSNYRWAVNIIGMDGSVNEGLAKLRGILAETRGQAQLYRETQVLYSFLLLQLGHKESESWSILQQAQLDPRYSPLDAFLLANMHIFRGQSGLAIEVLKNAPRSMEYLSFDYLDYLLGCSYLWQLNPECERYFELYLKRFKGRHYLKDACQKIAWWKLLQGDLEGYKKKMVQLRSVGRADTGGDEQAQSEAESGEAPDTKLLRLRLLYDGGYFAKAAEEMQKLKISEYTRARDMLELAYRRGRIYQALGEVEKALAEYDKTIKNGYASSYYFACNAALNAGILYEKKNDKAKATYYFEKCLDMKPSQYKAGLHQKAKAGLQRIKS